MTHDQTISPEQRLLNILEGTRAGTWEWNIQSGETIFNHRWAEIVGYDLAELLPTTIATWLSFAHPDDLAQSSALLEQHFRKETTDYACEIRMQHKEGHWVWVLDRGKVLSWTNDGKPLWMFGTHQDITERKKTSIALVESEERFKALSHASHGGVIIHDKGLILDCNQGLSEITGFAHEELVGMNGLLLIEPKSLDTVLSKIRSGYTGRYEVEGVRKDGSVYPLSIKGKNVHCQGSEVRVIEFYDLTEVKRAERRFEDIATSMGDWIWEVDSQGVYTYASLKLTEVLGYTPEEILGKTPFDLMSAEQAEAARTFFAEVKEQRSPFQDYENWNLHKDGTRVCLSTSGKPFFSEEGAFAGFRGVDKDITERIEEEELQSALLKLIAFADTHSIHELLQEFLHHAERLTASQIGFYHFVDEETGSVYLQTWSKSTLENFCTAEAEGLHYPLSKAGVWVDSIHQRRPVIHNDYKDLPHRKGLPDGHAPIIRELVVPVFRGDKIVAILGVGNKPRDYAEADIYKIQKLADLAWEIIARKQAEQALSESEERFKKMFRNHGAVMLLVNPKSGTVMDANDAAIDYYGYPSADFLGLSIGAINTMSPTEIALTRKMAEQGEQNCFEFKHRLASGEIRDVEVHSSPIQLDKQTILFSIVHDITQRKRLMEEQSRSAQLAALGTVAAGVAHEINNPIQGIMNYAALIKMKPEQGERNLAIAERIITESKRIAKITQDLLFYSKDSRVEMKFVDLAETIENALSLLKTKINHENIDLGINCQKEMPQLLVQPQSIQQVVINLVDNACDALRYKVQSTERKQIRVSTCLVEEGDAPKVCIDVYDNGIGMSEEIVKKAQEAFFTTKPPSEGTGLGLSIVNDIVKKHKGRIEITSAENNYTKMRIMLPAITAEAAID